MSRPCGGRATAGAPLAGAAGPVRRRQASMAVSRPRLRVFLGAFMLLAGASVSRDERRIAMRWRKGAWARESACAQAHYLGSVSEAFRTSEQAEMPQVHRSICLHCPWLWQAASGLARQCRKRGAAQNVRSEQTPEAPQHHPNGSLPVCATASALALAHMARSPGLMLTVSWLRAVIPFECQDISTCLDGFENPPTFAQCSFLVPPFFRVPPRFDRCLRARHVRMYASSQRYHETGVRLQALRSGRRQRTQYSSTSTR